MELKQQTGGKSKRKPVWHEEHSCSVLKPALIFMIDYADYITVLSIKCHNIENMS